MLSASWFVVTKHGFSSFCLHCGHLEFCCGCLCFLRLWSIHDNTRFSLSSCLPACLPAFLTPSLHLPSLFLCAVQQANKEIFYTEIFWTERYSISMDCACPKLFALIIISSILHESFVWFSRLKGLSTTWTSLDAFPAAAAFVTCPSSSNDAKVEIALSRSILRQESFNLRNYYVGSNIKLHIRRASDIRRLNLRYPLTQSCESLLQCRMK